jgi:uncharacterized protein YqgC (DUF456 family)
VDRFGAFPFGIGLVTVALFDPTPETTALLWILAIVLVAVGLFGTVVPGILPGAPIVLLGLLAAAAADGFHRVGWFTLTVVTLLAIAALILEGWASLHGARSSGASRLATIGAGVGTLLGFFFALPGLLIGPFVGAFAGELLARRGWRQAGKAGLGAWWGLLLATVLRSVAVMLMIGFFALAYAVG